MSQRAVVVISDNVADTHQVRKATTPDHPLERPPEAGAQVRIHDRGDGVVGVGNCGAAAAS